MEIVIIPTLVMAADTKFQVLSDVVATWPRTPPAVDVHQAAEPQRRSA
ncbi:MAG: hypothetical protein M3P01_11365 [Actinomycetota bacterium]|nr:hypothetical protein [Actinomycetota bacterium]